MLDGYVVDACFATRVDGYAVGYFTSVEDAAFYSVVAAIDVDAVVWVFSTESDEGAAVFFPIG